MTESEVERPGFVDLVGAGPGDPGLLTRLGAEVLTRADAVLYDNLVHPRLLDLAPAGADRIPVGKWAGHSVMPQEEINELLVKLARLGKRVVRLKGGDPYVFGRGAEEAEILQAAGVPFRVVPGVTAGVGVGAYAGIPVTHRGTASAVAFVTGHRQADETGAALDWSALARFPGTLVIYMGVTRLETLRDRLIAEGKPAETPAALVQSGTLARQRVAVGTLADLPERVHAEGLRPPGLVIVGEVVNRRSALAWYERLPLFGQRILVTRPAIESDRIASELEALGAEALLAPTVEIQPIDDPAPLRRAIERLGSFDWLVFTSANGVRHFLDHLEAAGRDLRALGSLKLAAIGPATAEILAQNRLRADLVPDSFVSEGLAAALRPRVAGQRVLLARADRGRSLLRDELGRVAHVEQVAVYRNADAPALPPLVLDRLDKGQVDWITLTSTAITERLHALLPEPARDAIAGGAIRLASISPITSSAASRLGWPIAAEANEATWPSLVAAIRAVVGPEASRDRREAP